MNNNYKTYSFVLFLSFLFLINGCCSSRYSYNFYRKKAEEALRAKDYKKAQNYYSIIYSNESKRSVIDREKTTWAFYRLGVIAEVTGNIKLAKGYYWGDSIDEGFYEDQRLTNWFAQAGWEQLDELNSPRTLEEILEFETTEPPEEEDFSVEKKKTIVVPTKKNEGIQETILLIVVLLQELTIKQEDRVVKILNHLGFSIN